MSILDDIYFGSSKDELQEEEFFPDSHYVDLRTTDRETLWNDVNEDKKLYEMFTAFIKKGKTARNKLIEELKDAVRLNSNVVCLNYGTAGVGKSQVSRRLAKTLAEYRGHNIIFIRNLDDFLKKDPSSYLVIKLSPKFKNYIRCFITYSFYETLKVVEYMKEGDMCIQDEVEKEMGKDSGLIRYMIDNVTDVAARQNKLSFIFNTPVYANIKNIHFSIMSFGRRRNEKRIFTKNNMITYGILNDKKKRPIGVVAIKVWERKKENEFYEKESVRAKTEIRDSGGGKTVSPEMNKILIGMKTLFPIVINSRLQTKPAMKSALRYIPEFAGIPSGMRDDIVNFVHSDYILYKKEQILPEYMQDDSNQIESGLNKTDENRNNEIVDNTGESSNEEERKIKQSNIVEENFVPRGLSLIDYISECIKEDFGEYYATLWDLIVRLGMRYEMVAEAIEERGIKSVSHSTIGNDFKQIRVGKNIKSKIGTDLVGIGYYTEDWRANMLNSDNYRYIVPHNEHEPDYIHEDGTVESIKAFWEYKSKYIYPQKDCKPEIDYCKKKGYKSFRLVSINFKYTIHKFDIRVVSISEERVILTPSLYKD